MRRTLLALALGLACLSAWGCFQDDGLAPAPPTPAALRSGAPLDGLVAEIVSQSGWAPATDAWAPQDENAASTVRLPEQTVSVTREVIGEGIAHYSFRLTTGPGTYDAIGIHRVVREEQPGQPIRTRKSLFLLHGDLKNFEGMWLPGQYSPNLADDFGLAAYLAGNGIDVWGMDQAWNLVPAEETDFAFMADWGLQRQIDDLDVGIAVARSVRRSTGSGFDKMLVLGYSSGGFTGYGLLNQETQLPPGRRQVGGFIAADIGVKSDNAIFKEDWAGFLAYYRSLYEAGQYQDALYFRDVSSRARTDPDGASPYLAGLTNMQAALFFGAGPVFGRTPAHYHAGIFEDGMPVGLQYITTDQWLDFLANTAAYEPIAFYIDYCIEMADQEDSPFDDHLGEITVPVLDIGGAGGLAPLMSYTVSLLGSSDITQRYVSLHPADEVAIDYGHIDIFTAENAPQLVWEPILRWVEAHSKRGGPSSAQLN